MIQLYAVYRRCTLESKTETDQMLKDRKKRYSLQTVIKTEVTTLMSDTINSKLKVTRDKDITY